ncbi:hypothetical protein GFI45_06100 [Salmonella enterica subsp. enterica]|nr:hypothetical protein [Salmonella enterica subsp. enterica serovar Vitkin]
MDESRKQFEYEAGQALNLPTSIIELARKGDGCDHAFDSMNIMQPLNGWWHWWKKSRSAIETEFPAKNDISSDDNPIPDLVDWDDGRNAGIQECAEVIRAAGIKVKE